MATALVNIQDSVLFATCLCKQSSEQGSVSVAAVTRRGDSGTQRQHTEAGWASRPQHGQKDLGYLHSLPAELLPTGELPGPAFTREGPGQ